MCDICGKEITTRQSWHADGSGVYHLACEFNLVRAKNGMPPFESVRNLKPGAVPTPRTTTGSVRYGMEHNDRKEQTKEVWEVLNVM